MSLPLVITDAGRAALIAAANDGTNAVRIISVGISATAMTATRATVALPGEAKRISTLSGDAVADDTIHLIVRDQSVDTYSVRSIALYLADGTLFAAYGQADIFAQKSAQAMLLLAIDIRLEDIAAETITFGDANFLNPPATISTPGVVELADDLEAAGLVDSTRALTPRGAGLIFSAANILAKLLSADGSGSGLDADMLDGQHGTYYTDIAARLGFTPFDKAGGNITGPTAVQGGFTVFGNIDMGVSKPIIQMNSGGPRIESPASNTFRIGNDPINTQFEIKPGGNVFLYGKRGIAAGVVGSGSVIVTADSPSGYALGTWSDADYTAIQFVRGGAQIGAITCSASATNYGTTSDYRAKTIVGPASGAVERIIGLNLYDLVFNNDPDRRVVCGLLAHEAAELFPHAIQGKKDAVDDDGEIVFQQADYSKFIPDILSALQQALLRIAALEKAA